MLTLSFTITLELSPGIGPQEVYCLHYSLTLSTYPMMNKMHVHMLLVKEKKFNLCAMSQSIDYPQCASEGMESYLTCMTL